MLGSPWRTTVAFSKIHMAWCLGKAKFSFEESCFEKKLGVGRDVHCWGLDLGGVLRAGLYGTKKAYTFDCAFLDAYNVAVFEAITKEGHVRCSGGK